MLIVSLIIIVIILGMVAYYIYYIAPRLNPFNRAKNLVDQDMIDDAILEYKKVLEKNKGNAQVHYVIAELYLKKGEIDEAVTHLEEVMKINNFSYEFSRVDVQLKLARAYLYRDEIFRAFQNYYDVLTVHPADVEALYHVAFISLGSEFFDIAQKHFDRLVNTGKKSFEVLFGAGMASFQNQKTANAIAYYRDALSMEPHSDITNLAMAFAQFRKRDYKTAINYAKMVSENSTDDNAVFISRRMLAFLYIHARKPTEGIRIFEELLEFARGNEMSDEVSMILYDLGFAAIMAERTEDAYEYWNQLYRYEMGYRNVQQLMTNLRKEMDTDGKQKSEEVMFSINDIADRWKEESFDRDFIWNICGLKSENMVDLNNLIVSARVTQSREGQKGEVADGESFSAKIDKFNSMDIENFRIISNRVVAKLGYSVDQILTTYREADGVDFLAHSNENKSVTLVWVRRWKGTKVGEIPLRNFAQEINDAKARAGIFITTSGLTTSGENALKRLQKITVVLPEQLSGLLADLI